MMSAIVADTMIQAEMEVAVRVFVDSAATSTFETMTEPTPQDLQNSINDGSIEHASSETLKQYLILLSHSSGAWTPRQENVVIGNMINGILLQRHINSLQDHITLLDKKNSKLQMIVVVLTIAAVIGAGLQSICSIIQTNIAVKQYNTTSPISKSTVPTQQQSATLSANPIHLESTANSQTTKKTH